MTSGFIDQSLHALGGDNKSLFMQAGLRTCLGKDSAFIQLKITAAVLCRFFEFQPVKGHRVAYRMMTTLSMANGIEAFVKRRVELQGSVIADTSAQSEQGR